MTVLAGIFGGSLLLLSGLFAFKDWERQRGREAGITLLFRRYSPSAEHLFQMTVSKTTVLIFSAFSAIRLFFRNILDYILTLTRTVAVVLGAHMIHIARGEHLMAEGKIPSTYFKLLHRHKEKINGTDIPKGIAQPDIPRRVQIHEIKETGTVSVPQVE